MIVPVLAGLGALACMSNPRRRRSRRRRNPQNDVDTRTIGETTIVIQQWRNKNATAFISVEARHPRYGFKRWEAKSQGPSAGGYSKPTQAAERMYEKLTGEYASWGGVEIDKLAHAAAAALAKRSNPKRRRAKPCRAKPRRGKRRTLRARRRR